LHKLHKSTFCNQITEK